MIGPNLAKGVAEAAVGLGLAVFSAFRYAGLVEWQNVT